jgi:DNA-binding PadR family transcriptional regulator
MAILLLLSEEPRNGYQLMQTIEERSGGRWRPSPGSMYPTLAQLEDEGLIRATERDAVRLFELTEAGRRRAAHCDEKTAPWDGEEEPATLADLKGQLKQTNIAAAQVLHAGTEEQVARASAVLAEARRNLYRILAGDEDV